MQDYVLRVFGHDESECGNGDMCSPLPQMSFPSNYTRRDLLIYVTLNLKGKDLICTENEWEANDYDSTQTKNTLELLERNLVDPQTLKTEQRKKIKAYLDWNPNSRVVSHKSLIVIGSH